MFVQIRLAVIMVGCLVAAPYVLFNEVLRKIPQLDDLNQIRSTFRYEWDDGHLEVITRDGAGKYSYLSWFPAIDEVESLVRFDRPFTIWVDDHFNWVWQIEQGGEIIISHSDVRAAVANNRWYVRFLPPFLLLIGGFAAYRLYRIRSVA